MLIATVLDTDLLSATDTFVASDVVREELSDAIELACTALESAKLMSELTDDVFTSATDAADDVTSAIEFTLEFGLPPADVALAALTPAADAVA